jgi:hypothetical protein
MKTLILGLTLSMLFAIAAQAELKWEQSTVELNPSAGDKQAVAHFKYQNTGTNPVHFKSVKASCGCTTTQTQKETVNPGEKGEIIATLNIGDRTGMQMKTVTVQTDDPNPAQATTLLTLKANITPAMEIKPMFVYWTSGEAPTPKKISLKAAKEFPARNITIKSNNSNFESKVEPGKSAGEWTIEVTPKDTSHPQATTLVIQTDYPKDTPKSFLASAQVSNPPQPSMMARPQGQAATPPAIPATSPASGIQH